MLSPLWGGGLAWRLISGHGREGIGQRFGYGDNQLDISSLPTVWVHAASAGEVSAAIPILQTLKTVLAAHRTVVTTITRGGFEAAQGRRADMFDQVRYAPYDLPGAVRRVMDEVKPNLLVIMETEIWPNLIHYAAARNATPVIVNGRISNRSLPKYQRLKRLIRWPLQNLSLIGVQTAEDARRFVALGADAATVVVIGNTKFDNADQCVTGPDADAWRRRLGIPARVPVLVVGSTRHSEEERFVLQAYLLALASLPELVLVHAPRHPERAQELVSLMCDVGLKPVLRTEVSAADPPAQQIILNTYGELAQVYCVASVAFVGNSLVSPGGGQNPLQPLAQGKPVLFGPYMQNFKDIASQCLEAQIAYQVTTVGELAGAIINCISQPDIDLSQRASYMLSQHAGAGARYAAAIELALRKSSLPHALPLLRKVNP